MGDLDHVNLPKAIGRYQVLRLLGSGAMGSVVLAEDPRIKRKVAIKLMKLDGVRTQTDQREYLARFQREAEVSGLLNHPGIVAIYDVGEEEGYGPFLAMEYVPGKPLDEIIKQGPPLPAKEKLRIAAGLAASLDHAHAKGIVHRDVKPGNVMVGEDGRTKLMDFGIAKREDASLTQTGTFLGTPSYASPEQIREGIVDNRSDIFSFGVLVFELMSGQSPFPGNSINTILYRIVNEPPVEVKPPVMGILPEGWHRVFGKVLAKRPEDRHATCTAFLRELIDAVVELAKEDRRELMGLLRMDRGALPPDMAISSYNGALDEAKPQSKASGWSWIAALLLVAALGGGWLYLRETKGTRLQINSTPTGAQVFVNDLSVGTTPMNQPLVAGDRLRIEMKGHLPIQYEFNPNEAPPTFPMQPVITEELLDSAPQGATVVLDEKRLEGLTPMKVQWNQGLAHRLTLTKGTQSFAVDFGPGESPQGRVFPLKDATTAETRPEPSLDPNAPGGIKLSGSFSVQLKVDGRRMGTLSPGSTVPLPPGSHKVELANPSHFYKEVRTLSLAAGQSLSLALPPLATLTIETFPGTGTISVDGQDTGLESDGSGIQVVYGRHTITVRGPKGIKTETVDVRGDMELRFPL